MYPALKERISALELMQRYPEKLFYSGNLELLKRPKVSIVGSRKPTSYSRNFTFSLAKAVISKNKPEYTRTNRNGLNDV